MNELDSPAPDTAVTATHRGRAIAAAAVVIAIGLSVRFPITSVSPLLNSVGRDYGLSAAGLAALSAIPVLLFGAGAVCAPALVARLGVLRAVAVLTAVLTVAVAVRPLAPATLFLGTVLVGASIAVLGILTPQIIREYLARRGGFWTGVYTTSFGVSAAAGAALAVPAWQLLQRRTDFALVAWSVPLAVTVAVCLVATRALGSAAGVRPGAGAAAGSVFRAPGLWPVTGFFAAQALIYFSLTAWLPTIAAERGMRADEAGLLLAWMSVAGLPASLIAPTLAARAAWRARLIAGVAVVSGLSLAGFAFGPLSLAPAMVAVLGVAQSAAFGLAIALIVFTAPSAQQTASFSAVSQGVGYAAAAAGPLLLGLLRQAGLDWAPILALLIAVALCMLGFGVRAARASCHASCLASSDAR